MNHILAAILMTIGAVFMFLAGLGVLRMPDVYIRMSTTSKAATLGVTFILLAVAIDFNDFGVATRALAAIVFVLLTAPVAAHIIGRAAYLSGVPLWRGTVVDEWGKQQRKTKD